MKDRVRHIQFKGVAETHESALSLLNNSGDLAVIERGRPRFVVIRCPCGCGENLFANLDQRAGPAWRIYRRRDKLTLFPSYWREDACESHFILWNDRILWCDFRDAQDAFWSVDPAIEKLILDILPDDHFEKFTALADTLDMIPWDVLHACRQLESRGLAVGDKPVRAAAFRRVYHKPPQRSWMTQIVEFVDPRDNRQP